MNTKYRSGALGALLDIYQDILKNFKDEIELIDNPSFTKIVDRATEDEDCRSIQTICTHVIDSAYYYADLFRDSLNIVKDQNHLVTINNEEEVRHNLDAVYLYTVKTFEKKYKELEDNLNEHFISTPSGKSYDFEKLLQHAIVHILRHHRQVKRFVQMLDHVQSS